MVKLHYDVLSRFNEHIYNGFISSIHLKEEVAVKGNEFWLAEYNKQKYLLPLDIVSHLPIVVSSYDIVKYRGKLYRAVQEYKTVKVTPEKRMSFRELVDWFDYKLSDTKTVMVLGRRKSEPYTLEELERNKKHFLLFKIFMLGAEIGRVNFRVSTAPGFGKDSIVQLLGFLMNDAVSISPRSVASIEYRLVNKLLVLNELSALESGQRDVIWKMLELVGDYKNVYEKSTRASSGTFDQYDISKLSLTIFYNRKEDYEIAGKGDKFFDNIFGSAIQDRFIPFKFEGTIDKKQFRTTPKFNEWENYKEEYLSVIKTIWWYRYHYLEEVAPYEDLINEFVDTNEFLMGRHPLSFYKLAQFMALYAENETDLKQLMNDAYKAYLSYYGANVKQQTLNDGLVEEVDVEDFV